MVLNPNDADTRVEKDIVFLCMNCVEEADACFGKAIELGPGYADAHNYKGVALMRQSGYEQAVGYFGKAIVLDPGHARAYWNKGVSLGVFGDEGAFECFDKALELDPSRDLGDGC